MGPIVGGTQIHGFLYGVLKKRSQNKLGEITDEEQQVLTVVKDIEAKFQCKILWGEIEMHGFASKEERLHFWSGKLDAVALLNKNDKNGSRVIVIDWRTCDDVNKFWENAQQYKGKLHQCIIYRRLLAIHMKEYFKVQAIPEPGIMVVAIDRQNINVNDPRLCLDFTELKNAGIFNKLNQFDWTVAKPNSLSKNGTGQGSKKNTIQVRLYFRYVDKLYRTFIKFDRCPEWAPKEDYPLLWTR